MKKPQNIKIGDKFIFTWKGIKKFSFLRFLLLGPLNLIKTTQYTRLDVEESHDQLWFKEGGLWFAPVEAQTDEWWNNHIIDPTQILLEDLNLIN